MKITLTFGMEQFCNDLLARCNSISKTIRDEALADIRADVSNPDGAETRSIICRAATEAWGNVKYAAQRFLTTGRTEDNNNLERLVSAKYSKPLVFSWDEESDLPEYEEGVFGIDGRGDVEDVICSHNRFYLAVANDGQKYWRRWVDTSNGIDNYPASDVYGTEAMDGVIPVKGRIYTDGTNYKWNGTALEETEEELVEDMIVYEQIVLALDIPNFNTAVTDALKSHIHKYTVEYALQQFLIDLLPDVAERYAATAQASYENIISALNARENFTMRRPSFI